jgi:hypothetical protein
MEEVGGGHRGGLRLQELPPRSVGAAQRRRRDPQRFEDSADRRRTDPVTEFKQLTLDPLVPLAVVLGGEALDQRNNLPADRRSACPLRIRPFPSDQARCRPWRRLQTILPLTVPLKAPQTIGLDSPKPPLTCDPARRTEPQTFYRHWPAPKEVPGCAYEDCL